MRNLIVMAGILALLSCAAFGQKPAIANSTDSGVPQARPAAPALASISTLMLASCDPSHKPSDREDEKTIDQVAKAIPSLSGRVAFLACIAQAEMVEVQFLSETREANEADKVAVESRLNNQEAVLQGMIGRIEADENLLTKLVAVVSLSKDIPAAPAALQGDDSAIRNKLNEMERFKQHICSAFSYSPPSATLAGNELRFACN